MTEQGIILVPRRAGCWVCEKVAEPDKVTVMLFSESGAPRRGRGAFADAMTYVRSMGYPVGTDLLYKRLCKHADHVEIDRTESRPAAPSNLTRIAPLTPAHWLDVNQSAINVANEALGQIVERMPDMKDQDLVMVAKIGITAAQKVGDWESRGRKMAQIDSLIRLASGLDDGAPTD